MGTAISGGRPVGLHFAIAQALHAKLPTDLGATLGRIRYVGSNRFVVRYRMASDRIPFGSLKAICVEWKPGSESERKWLEEFEKAG